MMTGKGITMYFHKQDHNSSLMNFPILHHSHPLHRPIEIKGLFCPDEDKKTRGLLSLPS